MLSRIAEALYWMGRYVERAEDTARILDVHYHLMLEDGAAGAERSLADLLAALGLQNEDTRAEDVAEVFQKLSFSTEISTSIWYSVRSAWLAARGAREAISSEMWECLNSMNENLAVQCRHSDGLHAFFSWVKDRSATFTGLVESTLSRDDGWRFLSLGRSLERSDMTIRLLSTRARFTDIGATWVGILRSCSAYEAYLRTYHRSVDWSSALELLLLGRLFPRSVYSALTVAERRLGELDPRDGQSVLAADSVRLIGQARSELEYLRPDELTTRLAAVLTRTQQLCNQANTVLSAQYFQQSQLISWTA
jgi:uncharacterized alpha-E superfamily protein